jgi:hypothetical protein
VLARTQVLLALRQDGAAPQQSADHGCASGVGARPTGLTMTGGGAGSVAA